MVDAFSPPENLKEFKGICETFIERNIQASTVCGNSLYTRIIDENMSWARSMIIVIKAIFLSRSQPKPSSESARRLEKNIEILEKNTLDSFALLEAVDKNTKQTVTEVVNALGTTFRSESELETLARECKSRLTDLKKDYPMLIFQIDDVLSRTNMLILSLDNTKVMASMQSGYLDAASDQSYFSLGIAIKIDEICMNHTIRVTKAMAALSSVAAAGSPESGPSKSSKKDDDTKGGASKKPDSSKSTKVDKESKGNKAKAGR